MTYMLVNGINVTIEGIDDISEQEIVSYIDMLKEDTQEELSSLTISPAKDGSVALDYVLQPVKFERIRRITGYLVGTIDRWNNAKRSEEHDRVKHGLNLAAYCWHCQRFYCRRRRLPVYYFYSGLSSQLSWLS